MILVEYKSSPERTFTIYIPFGQKLKSMSFVSKPLLNHLQMLLTCSSKRVITLSCIANTIKTAC
jgi:hypothetical protein